MTNAKRITNYRRTAAFLLALLLGLGPLSGLALTPEEPLSILLTWQSEGGVSMQTEATALYHPAFPNSYWLYADASAVAADAALWIMDNFNQYPGGFSIPDGQPLSALALKDAGLIPSWESVIEIEARDGQGHVITTYTLFISLQTPEPVEEPIIEETPAPQIDVTVTVNYLGVDRAPVASPTSQTLTQAGSHTIYPEPYDLPAGYSLAEGEPTQHQVTVFEDGTADRYSLDFIYEQPKAPIDVWVTVRYVDEAGNSVASDTSKQFTQEGSFALTPEAYDLEEGYVLADNEPHEKWVYVDENGTVDQSVISFTYVKPKAPIDVWVTVRYVDEAGNSVASDTSKQFTREGSFALTPEAYDLEEGYVLADNEPHEKWVYVDENGAVDQSVVSFTYVKPKAPIDVRVTVRYLRADDHQPVASQTEKQFTQAGTFSIMPEPRDLQAGYTLAEGEPTEYFVTVDEDGGIDRDSFDFFYQPVIDVTVSVKYLNLDGQPVASQTERHFSEAGNFMIYPEPFDLLEGYEQAEGQASEQSVQITQAGAVPAEVVFYYELPGPIVAPSVNITVSFVNSETAELIREFTTEVHDGTNAVEAEQIEGYRLIGEDTQYVTVTVDGADPQRLVFYYEELKDEPQVTTPPVPKAEFIDVLYTDQYGNVFYTEQVKCVQGEPTIIPVDLSRAEGYVLNDESEKTATIDDEGMLSPERIVFLFTLQTKVTLNYQTEDGTQVASPEVKPLTQAGVYSFTAPLDINPAYEPESLEAQTVEVRPDGTVSADRIVFLYRESGQGEQGENGQETTPPQPEQVAYESSPLTGVYIRSQKDGNNVRSTPTVSKAGDTSNVLGQAMKKDVYEPSALAINDAKEEWYEISFEGERAFIKKSVTEELSSKEIAEHMGWTEPPVTEQPEPTATPSMEGMPLNLWGETNVGAVNFRSSPNSKSLGNVIGEKLKKGTKVWIYAQEVNEADQLWYEVMIEGTEGYLLASVVDVYSQQQSDDYNASLPSAAPAKATPTPTPAPATDTPSPDPTDEPTPEPSANPSEQATEVPAPYVGYLLTTQQVALRTGANTQDESILATLPGETLLKAIAQTYVNGVAWHHVDVYNSGQENGRQSGFVPDSAVARISQTDALQYMKTATPSPAPVITPTPPQITGYARTLGDNVLLREYADTNAKISRILSVDTTVMVYSQEYVMGTAWHMVSYSGLYGFIRADQLRMLSAQETEAYLRSLNKTEPPIQATPEPLTPGSLSSYGFINTDKVRMRKEASTSSASLKLMDKNAFALVLGSVKGSDGADWYRINQNGTDGYVMGRYLTVLKLGELQQFLQSNDFQSGNTGGSSGGTNITPVEDHNKNVWQNPNIQTSYEPFNPIATATPPVEAIMSPVPVPTEGGEFVVAESATIDPLATFEPMGTEVPVKKSSGGAGGWIAVGIVGVLAGGGFYGWRLYRENQRKAAQRAAQRRQQAARQQQGSPTATSPARPGQPPQQRPAGMQQRPGQPGQTASPYAPPGSGQAQGTTAYRPMPPQQPGQAPPAQGTTAYRPITPQQPGQVPPAQGTTAYRPMPPQQPGQAPPAQGTTTYRPMTPQQPGQMPPAQGTTAYRPMTPQQPGQAPPAEGTAAGQSSQGSGGAQPGQDSRVTRPSADSAQTPKEGMRRRRTDRHTGEDKA